MANDRQQSIAFNYTKVPSDQTGMVIKITRAMFDDEVVDPSGANYAQVDGDDLRFYKNDDQTGEMAREIVTFEHDSSTGANDADCEVHTHDGALVLSSTADTTIYMEYGDAALADYADAATYGRDNVWPDYEAVWHFANAGNGTTDEFADSTGNGHDGTGTGTLALSGGGVDFDGTEYITAGQAINVKTSAVTLQVEVEMDTNNIQHWLLGTDRAQPTQGVQLSGATGTSSPNFHTGDGTGGGSADKRTQKGTPVTAGSRNYRAGSITASPTSFSDMNNYSDGSLDNASTTHTAPWENVKDYNSSQKITIGANDNVFSKNLNGRMFEARIRLSVLSADRLATEYANDNSPSTFGTPGAPTAIGSGFSGTIGQTLSSLVIAASATHTPPPITGTSAQTLASLIVDAAAVHTPPAISGSIGEVLSSLAIAATATHTLPDFGGTIAQVLSGLTIAASATHTPSGHVGQINQALASLAIGATATHTPPALTGVIAQTLASLVVDAAATHTPDAISGQVALALSSLTIAAAGVHTPPSFIGAADLTLASLVIDASGIHTPPPISGSIALVLASLEIAAFGNVGGFVTPAHRRLLLEALDRSLLLEGLDRTLLLDPLDRTLLI